MALGGGLLSQHPHFPAPAPRGSATWGETGQQTLPAGLCRPQLHPKVERGPSPPRDGLAGGMFVQGSTGWTCKPPLVPFLGGMQPMQPAE